jgi:hypothetical protein
VPGVDDRVDDRVIPVVNRWPHGLSKEVTPLAKRTIPPSRRRYEAAHPTVTARIPAAVKTALQARLAAEGLTFSEWVQAAVAGYTPDLTAAYNRGHAAGVQAGERTGYARGQAAGERQALTAGFRAGVLAAELLRTAGHSHYDAASVARLVLAQPGQPALVERVLPDDVQRAWRRLRRTLASP